MTLDAHSGEHVRVVAADTAMHRIHRSRPGSVAFFDTSEHGRFNLVDVAERDTCYLALDALGAYVETLGRILTRPRSDLDDRRHITVSVDRDLRLFNLTRSHARATYREIGLDLTATVGAGDDYSLPQRLARVVHEDGYDGIFYTARHDPAHSLRSVALFGPAGANDTDAVFASCKTDIIGDDLVDDARSTFGIVVLPYTVL